jgi:hypothetical protein
VGVDPAAKVAGYAYDVLYRQVKRDRTAHIKAQSNRCKASTKTRRGDLYAEGWIQGANLQLQNFSEAAPAKHQLLVQQYMDKNHADMKTSKARSHRATGNDHESAQAGFEQGQKAQINQGVGETKRPRLMSQ